MIRLPEAEASHEEIPQVIAVEVHENSLERDTNVSIFDRSASDGV